MDKQKQDGGPARAVRAKELARRWEAVRSEARLARRFAEVRLSDAERGLDDWKGALQSLLGDLRMRERAASDLLARARSRARTARSKR